MAEESVRPATEEVTPSPAAAMPVPEFGADAMNYQPLSLMALAAFGIAIVYATFVAFWGVFALWNRTPWLMPVWTFLAPVSAVILAGLARREIRRSEGTRSGLALTKWALNLSLLIGVVYIMYYAATFFAVRSHARNFSDAWLKKVGEGKFDDAFFDTIKPPRKLSKLAGESDKTALRRKIEIDHNAPSDPRGGGGGMFSNFTQTEFVRLLQLAEGKAVIEPEGVKDWDYEKGGYRVSLSYRVKTDLAEFPLVITVQGFDSPESGGRMWQVLMEGTGIETAAGGVKYTPEGDKLRLQKMWAERKAAEWVDALQRGQLYDVWLPITSGSPIKVVDGVFWADTTLRQAVMDEMDTLFTGMDRPRQIRPAQTMLPVITNDPDRLIFGFDVQLVLPREDATLPPLMIDGRVHVSADKKTANAATNPATIQWHVDGIELIRGRNAPPPPGAGPGGPPGPGQRPR